MAARGSCIGSAQQALTLVVGFCGWLNFVKEVQTPHYASQAEATPRVVVGEVSQISGESAARSCKVQNSCTEGGSNKGCFFVTDLSGKKLTMTAPLDSSVSSLAHDISAVTCILVERFYFVVDGRVLSLDSTLSQAGIGWNVSVRMCFRLNMMWLALGLAWCATWEGAGQYGKVA